MIDNSFPENLVPTTSLCKQAKDSSSLLRGLYGKLCELDSLRLAYEQLVKDCPNHGIDKVTLKTVEGGVESFLQQLSNDLRARAYEPKRLAQKSLTTNTAEGGEAVALRDLVVQATLKHLLESVFPPAFSNGQEPEKTIQWLARKIDKGFSRVYAVNVEECLGVKQHKRLLARVRQRIDDPDLIHLLATILATSVERDRDQQGILAPLLADIAFEDIDHLLQQARALGREGNFLHIHCTHVANQLVILLDQDARYDWLLPAVQKRLREELANLHYDLAAVETQSLDLTRGGSLRFLGFELRLVQGKHGESGVQYHPLEESPHSRTGRASPRRRRRRRYHPLRFLRPCISWIGRQWICQVVRDVCRNAQAIQVGWQHLPITLFPVLLFFFGWSSPMPWLCLAAIFLCNWRWILGLVRSAGAWVWRHKLNTALGVFAIAVLVALYPFASELYANLSREIAAPIMPPGFYLGQYNKGAPWDAELAHYGLYVPPHFTGQKGPFPLIVYLHGYGERSKKHIFDAGLPRSIMRRVGPHSRNGRFDFIAFFPIDPTGRWQTESAEVENAMMALDDVIERYQIDPTRVYLTGLSNGGSGVWRLAEAYPDKWAAVAPLSSFIRPKIQKVRHLPAWIFHGANDRAALVKRGRTLVQHLQEAKADVRYTEVPNKGHIFWQEVYGSEEFYDWLASKKKE